MRGGAPGTRETDLLDPAQPRGPRRRRRAHRWQRAGPRGSRRRRPQAAGGRPGLAGRRAGRGRAHRAGRRALRPGSRRRVRPRAHRRARPGRRRGGPHRCGASRAASGPGRAPAPAASRARIGSASAVLEDGTVVAALVAVNAHGTVHDERTGQLLAARHGLGDEFAHLGRAQSPTSWRRPASAPPRHTPTCRSGRAWRRRSASSPRTPR